MATIRTIDINHATVDELARLEGVGRERAQEIIRRRPFRNWEDVRQIPGLEEKVLEALQRGATIGGGMAAR